MPYIGVGTENSGAIELHYEDHGTGPPVVLIHGYPLSGRAWDRQVPALLGSRPPGDHLRPARVRELQPAHDRLRLPTWQTDFRDDLPKIDVPVLVVQGDADRILPYPNTGKRLPGLIKDMHLVVIDGGPHAIAWTHADQVNRALLDFLA